ncbi:MAG TPA: alpha-L-fucosidase, partial [Acidobacteriaceae bacterium]|nr:alpha-L-fucosidase [Acidobacteriaceae bacterium]
GTDPAVLDQQWVTASSKYDAQRKAILQDVDRISHAGPFRPDYESLDTYKVPEWYKDAKFGIFIHWGLTSVPAYEGWYARDMYMKGSRAYKHQIATYGPLDKFGYKDFIPMFKAEHFEPSAWARLFKGSGAKYVVPVFEHHDGFAMYDSGLSDWTVVKMGPHRDTGGELEKAVRAEGLHFGASSHRLAHDFFMGEGRQEVSDVNDPKYAAFYGPAHAWHAPESDNSLVSDFTYLSTAFANDWLARSAEIVEKYHPDIMYFDWWIGQPGLRNQLTKFAAFYYNDSLKYGDHVGVINYKYYAMHEHSAVLDLERGELGSIRPLPWQTDTSLGNKDWFYNTHEAYKTPDFVVHELIDIVSKNGNLLMDIGPRPDGTIPEEVQQTLLTIGGWLKVNGDAIYGTRPWKIYGEGPTKAAGGSFNDAKTAKYTPADFRFTTKGATLYAIEMDWPTDGETVIHALGTNAATTEKVQSVTLLGLKGKLKFQQEADGLHIQLPAQNPGKFAYAYQIEAAR